jgi:hypothetical protein
MKKVVVMKSSRPVSLRLYNDLQMTRRESELDAVSMRSSRDWTGGAGSLSSFRLFC